MTAELFSLESSVTRDYGLRRLREIREAIGGENNSQNPVDGLRKNCDNKPVMKTVSQNTPTAPAATSGQIKAPHSALPWHISTRFDATDVVSSDGYVCATTFGVHLSEEKYRPDQHWASTPGAEADRSEEETEANAAFIVRAVNSHANLLAALEHVATQARGDLSDSEFRRYILEQTEKTLSKIQP